MIDKQFIVERQGRQFVLYAGLLSLAHEQGLRRISTKLVQVPAEDNGQVAIVTAEVETERGVFQGIGDASPANVARAMLTATIRLAETRAKARALRDAVNISVAALEELAEDDDDKPRRATPARQAPVVLVEPAPATTTSATSAGDEPRASESQIRALRKLANGRAVDVEHLSARQAAELIARWQKEGKAS